MPPGPDTERAWAAGFYDGEGCTTLAIGPYPRASIHQIDRRPLDRFCNAVGVGKVVGPRQPSNPRARPQWTWVSGDWRLVVVMLSVVWDYLSGPKREQAIHVLEVFSAARSENHQLGGQVRLEAEAATKRRRDYQNEWLKKARLAAAGSCADCGVSLAGPKAKRCSSCHLVFAREKRIS